MGSINTQAVDAFLDAVQKATIPACTSWASDAVLDATVPGWRFRMNGPDEIRSEYSSWFADLGEFKELRRLPLPNGELVRYLLAWSENGVPHLAHHMHVLEVSDGLIRVDTVVCGGRWPAPLIAEMQAAQDEHDAAVEGIGHAQA
ncbi:MAG: hypothetical protein Q7L55_02345 [Actinomycetota bacterium]|nr:hypothetical protein [Actinomycetota bacterium]